MRRTYGGLVSVQIFASITREQSPFILTIEILFKSSVRINKVSNLSIGIGNVEGRMTVRFIRLFALQNDQQLDSFYLTIDDVDRKIVNTLLCSNGMKVSLSK